MMKGTIRVLTESQPDRPRHFDDAEADVENGCLWIYQGGEAVSMFPIDEVIGAWVK